MKLVKPKTEFLEQGPGILGIKKQIELAGRVCYKSEDKITETSCEEFVDRMIKLGHTAMLEHGTVYLKCQIGTFYPTITPDEVDLDNPLSFYGYNKYSSTRINWDEKSENAQFEETGTFYVSTNYRVLVENNRLSDLKYLCEPTEFHEKRRCVKFTCDRGVSHELVRHRVFSFGQESTRYCNYSKAKFGSDLTYVIPSWCKLAEGQYNCLSWRPGEGDSIIKDGKTLSLGNISKTFLDSLECCELDYKHLIESGCTPQQARQILPNALKTEVVMIGFISDWKHFFELRTSPKAHPDMQALAIPLQQEFKDKNYL